jgi:hypothetical protein
MSRKRDSRVARESEYRAAYHELWKAARRAEVPAVIDALRRFQESAVALHLSQPPHRRGVHRDPNQEADE